MLVHVNNQSAIETAKPEFIRIDSTAGQRGAEIIAAFLNGVLLIILS